VALLSSSPSLIVLDNFETILSTNKLGPKAQRRSRRLRPAEESAAPRRQQVGQG
jgi:hypothetical protein